MMALDAACADLDIRTQPRFPPNDGPADPWLGVCANLPNMMMAYDSSPTPPSGLAEETIERVRSALLLYLASTETAGPALRAALCAMATEAREKSMLPEQLLITLKDTWHTITPAHAGEPGAQTTMLQRVVTMCIKEYYGG
jgi:hypothetical protein